MHVELQLLVQGRLHKVKLLPDAIVRAFSFTVCEVRSFLHLNDLNARLECLHTDQNQLGVVPDLSEVALFCLREE